MYTFFPLNDTLWLIPNVHNAFQDAIHLRSETENDTGHSEYDRMLCDSYWAQLSGKHIFFSVCGESHTLTFGNKEEWVLPCLHITGTSPKDKGMNT